MRTARIIGQSARAGVPARAGGFSLIEYLIYIAVLAVVMGVAFGAFYRSLDNSRALGRSTDEILTTLAVGELWRKDVREATAPFRIVTEDNLTACEIEKGTDQVVYLFGDGSVWRKDGAAPPREILARVKSSTMLQDRRGQVTSWRWEIELTTRKKVVRMHPLFSFQAVPARLQTAP